MPVPIYSLTATRFPGRDSPPLEVSLAVQTQHDEQISTAAAILQQVKQVYRPQPSKLELARDCELLFSNGDY